MKVMYQKIIKRSDLQCNRNTALYLFGDNLDQVGMGGQAAEMRGEPNAIGIPTKVSPAMSESSFFKDSDLDFVKDIYDRIFRDIRHKDATRNLAGYSVLVIPTDGLGTGLARLPHCAPRIYEYLMKKIAELEAAS